MTEQWTHADEAKFAELSARRNRVVAQHDKVLSDALSGFDDQLDSITSQALHNYLKVHADSIRDALCPFDSGVRPEAANG